MRLSRGVGVWSPQTGAPLQDCLPYHAGAVTLHLEVTELPQQARLRWRLYRHAVPERLRALLDGTLPEILSIRESDAADLAERQARLTGREEQLADANYIATGRSAPAVGGHTGCQNRNTTDFAVND